MITVRLVKTVMLNYIAQKLYCTGYTDVWLKAKESLDGAMNYRDINPNLKRDLITFTQKQDDLDESGQWDNETTINACTKEYEELLKKWEKKIENTDLLLKLQNIFQDERKKYHQTIKRKQKIKAKLVENRVILIILLILTFLCVIQWM